MEMDNLAVQKRIFALARDKNLPAYAKCGLEKIIKDKKSWKGFPLPELADLIEIAVRELFHREYKTYSQRIGAITKWKNKRKYFMKSINMLLQDIECSFIPFLKVTNQESSIYTGAKIKTAPERNYISGGVIEESKRILELLKTVANDSKRHAFYAGQRRGIPNMCLRGAIVCMEGRIKASDFGSIAEYPWWRLIARILSYLQNKPITPNAVLQLYKKARPLVYKKVNEIKQKQANIVH